MACTAGLLHLGNRRKERRRKNHLQQYSRKGSMHITNESGSFMCLPTMALVV
jgi:hypothetical protein